MTVEDVATMSHATRKSRHPGVPPRPRTRTCRGRPTSQLANRLTAIAQPTHGQTVLFAFGDADNLRPVFCFKQARLATGQTTVQPRLHLQALRGNMRPSILRAGATTEHYRELNTRTCSKI